jgi:hypothetical protein
MSPHSSSRVLTFGVLLAAMAVGAPRVHAQTVHVRDDTNINLSMPAQTNGLATTLLVRNSGSGGERHTYLQFDTSSLPSGAPIAQARLRFWVVTVNDPGLVDVYVVGGPWNEETLSAAGAPPLAALIGTVNVTAADQSRFVLLDVTAAVQGWLNGSLPNYGLALVPTGADPVRITLDSKESTMTSHGPEIEVAVNAIGDITGVAAGTGLVGGGAIGDVGLALDTAFTDTRYAAALHGHDVSQIANAAGLGANTFTATQIINTGNLDLDPSTETTGNLTKNGTRFLHNFGTRNAFLGPNAGNFFLTGADNTAAGSTALSSLGAGFGNTAMGSAALQANSNGVQNTGTGVGTLQMNGSGSNNTASGAWALNNTTGDFNVGVGAFAGSNATTGSNNIYLGSFVQGVAAESNAMYLGRQGTQTKTFIAGVRGITTVNPDAIPVMIDSAGQLGTVSSSVRFKEDIRNMADTSSRLLQLRPVTFRYKQPFGDGSKPVQYGLVAEEVAAVFPELAVRNADGDVETVHYQILSVLLLNEWQKLQTDVERQRARLELLEQRLVEISEPATALKK